MQGTKQLQGDLQDFFVAEEMADHERILRATMTYLRSRLFNPLYNLNIERLNEEIAHVRALLPVSSFMISDQQGRVLTDGAPDNPNYGKPLNLPMAELARQAAVIRSTPGGSELFFVIDYDNVIAGYACVKLTHAPLEAALGRLDTAGDKLWKDYQQVMVRLMLVSVFAIIALGGLLSVRLSHILARPLTQMSEAAHEYAAGRLEKTLPVRSTDELGQLAESLNKLAQDLYDHQKHLAQAQRIARLGFWDWQPDTQQLRWSEEIYRIFGVHPATFTPAIESILDYIKADERETVRACFLASSNPACFQLEFTLVKSDGAERIVLLQSEPSTTAPASARIIGTMQDITERKRTERQLIYLANYDALTALPNRALFQDRLGHALRRADRNGSQLALLFLDLDRFKAINDTLGHGVGDELLKIAARRLADAVRESDTVARLGGDEFTLLLENIASGEEISSIADKVLKVLSQPFIVVGRELSVSASIGIALYPGDASDTHTLLKHADIAMYQAKEQGRAAYCFFTGKLSQQIQTYS